MIKKDTNGRLIFASGPFWKGYKFQSGNFEGLSLGEADYRQFVLSQEKMPVFIMRQKDKTWWMFRGNFYYADENFTIDKVISEMLELERSGEGFDEKIDADVLSSLPIDDVKEILSIRSQMVEDLYNNAKKEYDEWVLKGKSAVQQAAKEFLKPGEDIRSLEKFIGKMPVDFMGGGTFEFSSVYRKWITNIEELKRRLENAKKILRTRLGFPDIGLEAEGAVSNNRRETIPDNVKMQVWKRDGGKCVRCGSQEKLEYDHIIPLSKGGSNTARNIQLLCERCNRTKGGSLV